MRDARVRRIRRLLAQRSARRSEGAFVVEGVNVLDAALDGEADLEALFAAPGADEHCAALLDRAHRRGIAVHHFAPGVLERVADTVTPQPVLAIARRRPPSVADVTVPVSSEPKLLVVGVDVRDPGNAGTLIRSAESAGAHGVIFCRGSVDVTNPKTVRASAGALFHVPVVEGCDPQEVLGVLGDLGHHRIAAVAHGGERPDRVDLNGPLALVFGNEASGLPADVLDHVDCQVTIPMPGRSESLNLGMAASILLYEVRRQRAPAGVGSSPQAPGGAGVSPEVPGGAGVSPEVPAGAGVSPEVPGGAGVSPEVEALAP